MNSLSLQDIAKAVGGRLSDPSAAETRVSVVCTDTRRMQPASLFIALRGENFDGHRYLGAAAAGGAVTALVETPPAAGAASLPLVIVPDARKAMGRLANHLRRQLRGKVIAVAGSNGKTSTKYLIHAVLGHKLRGSMSPKSFNNDIGVPLAIFPAMNDQDYLVLELGTNHPGEIAALADIARPDIAIITNCGADHLEFLGSLEGVRRENAQIIQGLNPQGLLIVNGDDPELLQAVAGWRGERLTFGFNVDNDLHAANIVCDHAGVHFLLNQGDQRYFLPMLGRHNIANALAAVAVARRLGLSDPDIAAALKEAHGPEMRLQVHQSGGIRIINDAYNANPDSMLAALRTLKDLPCDGRRIAILGDMRELGDTTELYHREIGRFSASCALDALYCVGTLASFIADAALGAGMPADQIHRLPNATDAAASIPSQLRPGDLVLLKASRGIRLELIAQAIGV